MPFSVEQMPDGETVVLQDTDAHPSGLTTKDGLRGFPEADLSLKPKALRLLVQSPAALGVPPSLSR